MKKSLLALAVLAAVSGAASAQSSVTLYGKIDLGLVLDSGSPTGGKSVRISSGVSGGSRLGFKGVEDLGGGLKASFQLETGYCADGANGTTQPNFCTGSNQFMGRQAHGDLTGGFGAMSAGRQYSLGFTNLTTIDPFGTGFAPQTANTNGGSTFLVDTSGTRLNNSFQYTTPNIAGFAASGEIALGNNGVGEQTGDWTKGREFGGALTYASGPAYAGATYYQLENGANQGDAKKVYLIGGTYDFGVVKIHALAQHTSGTPVGAASFYYRAYMAGVTVPLGGGQLMASYIDHDDKTTANTDARQWGLGYLYPLSKRTSFYTSFGRVDNDHGATFKIGNATEVGTGNKSFDFGVVHNF